MPAKPFSRQLQTSKPPVETLGEMLSEMSQAMHRWGDEVVDQSPAGITFARAYHAWWGWVLFPLGLLFSSKTDTIKISLHAQDGGTLITIAGVADGTVRKAFEGLQV